MGQETTLQRKGTAIGAVRGVGAAHHGTGHWMLQRLTSVGNFLSVAYLVISLILLPDLSHATVYGWLSHPVSGLVLALLVVSVFWHARLGLTVLIEDYLHTPGNKFAALLVLNLAIFAGAGFGLLSIVRIVLGGAA